jgi:hypothetical protein
MIHPRHRISGRLTFNYQLALFCFSPLAYSSCGRVIQIYNSSTTGLISVWWQCWRLPCCLSLHHLYIHCWLLYREHSLLIQLLTLLRVECLIRIIQLTFLFENLILGSPWTIRGCWGWWQVPIYQVRFRCIKQGSVSYGCFFILYLWRGNVSVLVILDFPCLYLVVRFLNQWSVVYGWCESSIKILVSLVRAGSLTSDVEVEFTYWVLIVSWIKRLRNPNTFLALISLFKNGSVHLFRNDGFDHRSLVHHLLSFCTNA